MQTKKTTHPPLGNRTTTAGSCVRSNLGSPSPRKKIIVTPKVPKLLLFLTDLCSVLVPMMWLISFKNPMDNIFCLKVSHPSVPMMGEKRFLVSTEFSRLMRLAGNRRVPSFTAGACFFPMFYKRFPMSRSLNVINMSWPGLWVPISSGHCLLWTNNFTWPSCKKKANGLLVTFLSAAFPMDLWSFKPSSNCWYHVDINISQSNIKASMKPMRK